MDRVENGNASSSRVGTATGAILAIFLLFAVLTLALLLPLPPLPRVGRAILDLGHAPAFAVVTFLLFQMVCRLRPATTWPTLVSISLLMIVFGCASEIVQSQTGRGLSLKDAIADTLGVVAGACWIVRGRLTRPGIRTLLSLASVGLLCIPSVRPVMIFVDDIRQQSEMPILASFESEIELSRWLIREGQMSRTHKSVTDGVWALRVDLVPGEYPGVTMIWPTADWSAYDELVFDVTIPERDAKGEMAVIADEDRKPLTLILKVEDTNHNGEYEDRFHRALELKPGRHEIRVALSEIEIAPRSRALDLRDVARIQLFLNNPKQARTLFLDHFRLE